MRFDVAGAERAAFERDFDVCVVGAGPAGVTLARSLASEGFDVALMEAGGLEWSPESQDVYAGENVGHDYFKLDEARLRFFGGTSYHWNGLCRALDAADFEPRPQNPLSGWPIGRTDLDPYTAATHEILELAPESFLPDLPEPEEGGFRQIQYYRSPPVRFGEKYLDEITASERISLGLNANLVDLRLDPGLGRVTQGVFKSYAPDDPGFALRARTFCLCTGGIENARLLLNFRSQIPQGVGNRHDMVGRFFCEHPQMQVAEALFEAPGLSDAAFFAPTEAFLAGSGTMPIMLRLDPRRRRERSLVTELAREAQCRIPFGDRLIEAVTGRAAGRCDTGGLWEYRRSLDPESYPWGYVDINSEQILNPDSRVTLAESRDAFGLNRVRLNWAPQEADFETIRVATLAFAEQVAATGIGRLRIRDRLLEGPPVLPNLDEDVGHVASWHHMCATRMSADPASGVVDRDCRVHGMENLYVGGSSVFASPSFANPTYTIVQLALRLGDHLAAELHGAPLGALSEQE